MRNGACVVGRVRSLSSTPPPDAPLEDEVGRWMESLDGDLVRAYEECRRPDWLMRIAVAYNVPRIAVVRAAAEAAALAIRRASIADIRPARSVSCALRWANAEGGAADAWAAAFAASHAADELEESSPSASAASRAAAAAGFACDPRADAFFYAQRGYPAEAMEYACRAFGLAKGEGRARCLEVARRHITLSMLQRAAFGEVVGG